MGILTIRTRVLLMVLALALAPWPARADKRLDGGQVHNGVAVEPHLATSLFSFGAAGTGTAGTLGTLQGGIFGGYKVGRVIFGLSFDLTRVSTGQSVGGGNETTTARTNILFSPGLRVALARSADRRVELFGQFDIGFGTTVTDPSSPNTSFFHLAYDVGPGVRYWAHPQFAFGGVGAVAGQFEFDKTNVAGTVTKVSTGLTSIIAELQLLGVF